MPATRRSSRQAAQKAKEAISDTSGWHTTGMKRKRDTEKVPGPKKERKKDSPPQQEIKDEDRFSEQDAKTEAMERVLKEEDHAPAVLAQGTKKEYEASGTEAGVKKSREREDIVPSSIVEKGAIYFFYRPRVNIPEAQSMSDVARSFIVLRPIPRGTILSQSQCSLEDGAQCRLLVFPKKKLPTTGSERDMGFVEKAGQSMKQLQENFIAGGTYETVTRGERTIQEAKPHAEGVYAIISDAKSSHLAYILTIPEEIGEIQKDLGLQSRGSWIVQSKNPKFPGPSYARLPKDPEYPEHIQTKFGNLRWIPLKPELIDYPNAQFLMIGSAHGHLGRAASVEADHKKREEERPGEELEQLGWENENRIEGLRGDHTVFEDLGLDANKYPKIPTTWHD